VRRRPAVLVGVVVLAVAAAVTVAALQAGGDGHAGAPATTPTVPDVDLSAPFPDATTTGVPAGTTLTPSGSLDVKSAGTVLEGLDIDGCVDVHADNVTIRASRISCARPTTAVRLMDGYSGLRLEDVEIDGNGIVSAAVGFTDYTLVRVNIHGVVDGPRMGSRTVLVDSYVHGLVRTDDSHNDAVQVTGGSGVSILHNTLDAYDPATGDLFNAAIMVGTGKDSVADLLIEGNYLNGGNYTVTFRPNLDASNIVGRGNTFGPDQRYGPLAHADSPGITWTWLPDPSATASEQG